MGSEESAKAILPGTQAMTEDEMFKILRTGKRKKKAWKRIINKDACAFALPASPLSCIFDPCQPPPDHRRRDFSHSAGPQRSGDLPRVGCFIPSRFLTVPGPVEGPGGRKRPKTSRRYFFHDVGDLGVEDRRSKLPGVLVPPPGLPRGPPEAPRLRATPAFQRAVQVVVVVVAVDDVVDDVVVVVVILRKSVSRDRRIEDRGEGGGGRKIEKGGGGGSKIEKVEEEGGRRRGFPRGSFSSQIRF